MKITRSPLAFAALAAGCSLLLAPAARAQVTFTPLGHLAGGDPADSGSWSVSADGSVVVGDSASAPGYQAFRWQGGVLTGLGFLTGGDFSESSALGVSGDGSVVVGYSTSANGWEAFRWKNGTLLALGDLPGGNFDSYAAGVSASGAIVVGGGASAAGYEAFRWQETSPGVGQMTGLGDLPGSDFYSFANAVSADGAVVVGRGSSDEGDQAFRWTAAGGMVALGFLPAEFPFSEAMAASADGSTIVGFSATDDGDMAFRWEANQMVALGDLSGGGTVSSAWGVSADGSVVVGQGETDNGQEAFLWREDLGLVNLRTLTQAAGATGLANWSLERATALSQDGTTVTGYGVNPDGSWEAFALRATNPGGFLTLGAAHTLSGQITLQGLAAAATPRPVTLEFRRVGKNVPLVATVTIGGATGQQAISFPIPPGQYNVAVKGAQYLRQVVSLTVPNTGSGTLTLPNMTLLTGDVNNDNRVNLTDLVQLRANYGLQGTNLAGDLNGDGRVNLTDLVLLRANYGKQGQP